jgi:hypothetical protein
MFDGKLPYPLIIIHLEPAKDVYKAGDYQAVSNVVIHDKISYAAYATQSR